MEIKCAMSSFSKTNAKQFHFALFFMKSSQIYIHLIVSKVIQNTDIALDLLDQMILELSSPCEDQLILLDDFR